MIYCFTLKKTTLENAIQNLKEKTNEKMYLCDVINYEIEELGDIGLKYWFELGWNEDRKEIEILNIREKGSGNIATNVQGEHSELFCDSIMRQIDTNSITKIVEVE